MRKNWCVNGELDDHRYSSPVPIIGLYVGLASLVCFLFMLFDILSGFRRRKRHLPCRFFSLNSVTLSLLSITSKLPTDLTSKMPRAIDQLSKLTGTVMICVAMGFVMPSLGLNRKSDSIGNMIALSILVITIVVDVSLQIATGAIFLFLVEHVIVLTLMLLLLLGLWISVELINNQKEILMDRNKKVFATGDSTMLHRLKRWYVCSSLFNPQLILCKDLIHLTLAIICLFCSVVILEVTVRTFAFKEVRSCQGSSDYKWSVWMIFAIQNLTIITGTLAACFRSFTLLFDIDYGILTQYVNRVDEYLTLLFMFIKKKLSVIFLKHLVKVIVTLLYGAFIVIVFCIVSVLKYLRDRFKSGAGYDSSVSKWKDEFKNEILDNEKISIWMMKACLKDMDILEARNKRHNFPTHMLQLLSKSYPPHHHSLASEIQSIGEGRDTKGQYKVTCLSMVILVRLATISMPSRQSEPLKQALDEAFEIIYFIDKKINAGYFLNRWKLDCAKLLWQGEDVDDRVLTKRLSRHDKGQSVDYALESIEKLFEMLPNGLVDEEVYIMQIFITQKEFVSIEDFSNCLEQLFVDMLHLFLTQLPKAIFKEIAESPLEECEERSRTLLNILYKLEPLEDKVQWSFPEDSGVKSLLNIAEEVFTFPFEDVSLEMGHAPSLSPSSPHSMATEPPQG